MVRIMEKPLELIRHGCEHSFDLLLVWFFRATEGTTVLTT